MKTTISKNGTIKLTATSKRDSLNLLKFIEAAAGRSEDPDRLSLQKGKELEAEEDLETCESCMAKAELDSMHTDGDGNYLCAVCWAVLAPEMKSDYDQMVKRGEIQ